MIRPVDIAASLSHLARSQLSEIASFHPDMKVTHSIDARVLPMLIRAGLVSSKRIPVPGWPGMYSYTGITELGRVVAAEMGSDD